MHIGFFLGSQFQLFPIFIKRIFHLLITSHTYHSTGCFLLLVLYVEVENNDGNNKNNNGNSDKSFICHFLIGFNRGILFGDVICFGVAFCGLFLLGVCCLCCCLLLWLSDGLFLCYIDIFEFRIYNIYNLFKIHLCSIFHVRFKLKVDIIYDGIYCSYCGI